MGIAHGSPIPIALNGTSRRATSSRVAVGVVAVPLAEVVARFNKSTSGAGITLAEVERQMKRGRPGWEGCHRETDEAVAKVSFRERY